MQAGNHSLTGKFQHEDRESLPPDRATRMRSSWVNSFPVSMPRATCAERNPEAVFTESGVVARQGNDGRGGLAAFAYHDEANSGAGRGCALQDWMARREPVNWFSIWRASLVKPGKTGGTRSCGMIFMREGGCDPDHCLFPVRRECPFTR